MQTPSGAASPEIQAFLDASVDAAVLTDHRGLIQVFNRGAERLFGYRATTEVLGGNVGILMTEHDRNQHDAYIARYLRTGVAHSLGLGREVQARRNDGSLFPAFLSVGRIGDSDPVRFVAFIQDMTLHRQALRAMERERDRAQRYLQAAQTMLVGLDGEGRVTMINRKGCEVLGCDERSLLGAHWFESVVPGEHRAAAALDFKELVERQPRRPHHFECPVLTRGGVQRLIMWRALAVEDEHDAVIGVHCSGDDITDSRRGELELTKARERISQASRLATMGEMASGMSHELNQPLAAITTYAQSSERLLASATPDLTEVRKAQQQIAAQALRAGGIIRHLRGFVRNRAVTRETVNLNELVAELQPLIRADARASDVRVIFELDPSLPNAKLDRSQLQQVVLNLLRNSIDAVQPMAADAREALIRTRCTTEGEAQLAVLDNGVGIDASIRERLFTPFVTSQPSGAGLGLAISHTIVEAHHGRLEYQPNRPRGAIFTLTLPSAGPLEF